MDIGRYHFDLEHKSYVMGILNVTPDSFSDGGKYQSMDAALRHVEQMIEDGADIIDIGGESTRPGHEKITDAEEIERVIPVIETVKERFDVAVSLDTYKYGVAEAGLLAGADMLNDIWGLKWDPRMAPLLARSGAACCLMHNREDPAKADFLAAFAADMKETLQLAEMAGIDRAKIVLDPGVGFGKTYEQNLSILNHLSVLAQFGYPMLLGTSRKSVIGLTLSLPVTDREEGTQATTVLGRMSGCAIFRVHDVKRNRRVLDMTDAILGAV